ncbi:MULTISPECIES: ABC transporter ATP-binding protein [Paenibacillus]|uniref:ABC transporter ATP-binding protein n=1 Tax=Paenibacillus TaxID=44249 RepID=UPI00096F9FCD|nr:MULTISPECIES: ABC transporter ATP-binding protein [Paenibacillus]MCP1423556.1 ATP-binding cassette subfamily B protein [Paenibacillus xylanexedens]OMF40604.1 multidrug ABC transporter ATP-binding protein [Paenibacillus amylolyticus]PJN58674.1 putative multidrug resistance ABC transporter ATP-binding/permease protein YheI [Paenibacillus sp. GM1FR]WFA84496.1 ABC transporter ATP-binding protein/permease [Paenibacillus amylolyticus]
MMKLFRMLKPYQIPIIFILVLVLFQSLAELYLPTLMADIVNDGIIKGDIPYIWQIGGWMLVIAIGGTACSVIASYLSSRTAGGFAKQLRSRVFRHVENFSLQEFDKMGTASLITRTTNDITQVQNVLTMMLRMMIMAPLMCIGGIFMAVSQDAKLSTIFLVVLPVLGGAIALIGAKGLPLFKTIQKKLDRLNLVLREQLTGIRVVRSFNRGEHEKVRFNGANTELRDSSIKVNVLMATIMPVMMLVMNFSMIAILYFGGMRIDTGNMNIGALIAFIQYAMQIMFSLIMVSMIFVMIPRASASAERINEVLDMQPDLSNPEQPRGMKSMQGMIEFDNVTFRYPGAENPALSDISFTARSGETTAIIGGTGSGKSTLLSLIPRFYDVTEGSVRVNGTDVREIRQEDLRAKIGFVPQKAVLFTGTITENIRHGKDDATMDEVVHAARTAQAENFITEMKEGYDSLIAQGGNNVSGGQKQRLSIARALVRRPEVYIFDDSFSALDFKTDAKLRAALKSETTEAAVLIVAQRVSTVMDADRILVMDEGRIVGSGTHKELLEHNEVYREIVSSQLTEEEIA